MGFQFNGTGVGSTPSLGVFNTQVAIFFGVNANTITGSDIITTNSCTISTSISGGR
jgi:hypothetical protein